LSEFLTDEKRDMDTPNRSAANSQTSQSIDWYHEGEERVVDVAGVQVTVRLVGRKGRRARIAITAPAGAAFHSLDIKALSDASESLGQH
jgi:hypothetical protein